MLGQGLVWGRHYATRHSKLTLSRFANKEAIHMNAKMMMSVFCKKVPRAPVRRNTMMKVDCYKQFLNVMRGISGDQW